MLCGYAFAATTYAKLKKGDAGSEVVAMQQALKSLGFSIEPDGKYGLVTERIVKQFQKKYSLDADGVAGNQTLTLLYQMAPAYAPSTSGGSSTVLTPTATPAYSAPTSSSRLEQGNEGAAVAEMQAMLAKLGYSIAADGKFGYATYLIVKSFQSKYGLTADGIAGAQTFSLLRTLTSAAPTNAPAVPTATPTLPPQSDSSKLQQGDEGEAVRALQNMLIKLGYNIPADGKFGYVTYTTVKSFQSRNGLYADGIAGAQTLALLVTLSSGSAATTPVITVTPSPTPTLPPVSLPTTPITYTRLERGSEGPAVVELQSMLAKLGYSISADGKFGYATYQIVKSFQSKYRLTADGIAGSETIALLKTLTGATAATPTQTVTATPTVAPAPPAGTASSSAVVTTSGGILYFRATPNRSGEIIGRIPNRTTVAVMERGAIWTTIVYNGAIGYVMTSFLTFVTAATATPTAAVTPTPPTIAPAPTIRRAQVTGGKLNLRAQPSKSSAGITVIPDGAYISVLSEGATWSAVTYESYSGYVMTRYFVYVADPTPTPPPAALPSTPVIPTMTPTATPGYDASVLNRTLSSGMTGNDVTLVQTRLITLGYLSAANGTYDANTVAAVRSFQRIHGLSVDGVAGKQTFTVLFSSDAMEYTADTNSYSTLHIYYQSADPDLKDDIERMQARLSALGYTTNVTGKFDETTYMAVLAFQLRNNLTVDGVGSVAMQTKLFSSSAKSASASPSYALEEGAGKTSGPSTSSIKLLHWFNDVKPSLSSGDHLTIYDPASGRSWTLRLYAAGNHADSEPLTLRDTMIMNEAFGKPSWTTHAVYVQLPSGQWTIASMHNHPHLTGSIKANGFDGHLCVHFLRDMTECQKNDPNYGVTNQKTIRNTWQRLTGETIDY